MDIEKLRGEHKDLTTRARAIQQLADDEKRELSQDEATHFEGLIGQAEQVASRIVREEALAAHEDGSRSSFRAPTRPQPATGNQLAAREPQRFRSLGELMQSVAQASRPGTSRVDPRLLEQRAALGLSEAVPSDGGFFVQQDFSSQLVERVYEVGQIASRVQRIPLSGNANGIKLNGIDETSRVAGSRWGGVQAYWAAEADSVTATKPKFRQIELNLHKLFATVYATDELLADASALETITRRVVAQEIAFKLDDAILRGTGNGQPLGILESASLVSVSKETGQAAASIVSENLINMWSRAEGRRNAVWLHNQDIEPQLFTLGIQVGVGGSTIYMPPGGLSANPYSTLFGRPMVEVEHASTLGTVGDIVIADLDQYLLIEKPMQSAMSIHVQFLTDQTVFRFVYRVDGQPAVHSALTPYKGSATRSPFVALATRA
jgi:HK97 family phage major capsid protein